MKKFKLITVSLTILAPQDMPDSQAEQIINPLEETLKNGLTIFGEAIIANFGNGELTFEVKA